MENDNRVRLMTELFLENYRDVLHDTLVNTQIFTDFQTILEETGVVNASPDFKKNCWECVYDKACPYRILTGGSSLSLKDRLNKISNPNRKKKVK